MTSNTITPVVTPQQQMTLAFHGFSLPEGTLTDAGPKVWVTKVDESGRTQWAEALGRDFMVATQALVSEIARNRKN